jgi:hypothetical protein
MFPSVKQQQQQLNMEHDQDLFKKGSSSNGGGGGLNLNDSDPLLDLSDNADENEADFFDKFIGNPATNTISDANSHSSFDLSSGALDLEASASSMMMTAAQSLLLEAALHKSSDSFDGDVDVADDNHNHNNDNMEDEDALLNGMASAASFHPVMDDHDPMTQQQAWSSSSNNFNNSTASDGGHPNPNDATFGNAGFSNPKQGPGYNAVLGGGGANPLQVSSSKNVSSSPLTTLRKRKGGPPKRSASAVIKANMTAAKLRSTTSDTMLARHLHNKGRHHCSQPYNMNSILNHNNTTTQEPYNLAKQQLPRNAVSLAGIVSLPDGGNNNNNNNNNHLSGNNNMNNNNSNMFRNSNANMHNVVDVELEGGQGCGGGASASGIKNAIWGSPPAKRESGTSNLFSSLLSTTTKHSLLAEQNSSRMVSDSSTGLTQNNAPSLLNNHKSTGLTTNTMTNTSMQDLMWLSKTQTKTQALLRQSSAHSLLRQTSSQSLKDTSRKVDVSYLLPPRHASLHFLEHNNNNNMPNNNSQIETTSLLHQSCRLYPTTAAVVESALRIDPDAVRRAVAVTSQQMNQGAAKTKKPQEIYAYPINIAIKHDATMEVVQMLVQAGPDVLVQADGTDGAGSLGIALLHKCSLEFVNVLVTANPSCARVADRRANYPLHIAVAGGLSLAIVKRLHMAFPKALEMRNFHSQTPLDMAQRSTRCPEPVMNYLQSAAFPYQEDDHDDGAYQHHHNMDENHHDHYHSNSVGGGDLEDALDDIMETNL